MPIQLVGEVGIAGMNTGPIQTLDYNSTDRNTLVLVGLFYNGAGATCDLSSIIDSAGNTWEFATSASQDPPFQSETAAGQSDAVFVAWCIGAAAASSVTITRTDSGNNWWRVTLAELSGVGGLDSSAGATGPSSASASAGLTLTDPGSIVVGSCDSIQSSSPNLPPGWTGFSSSGDVCNAYGFPGVTGAYAPAYTFGGPTDWAVAVAAFKPAGSGSVSGAASLQGSGSLTTAAIQPAASLLTGSGSLVTSASPQAGSALAGQSSLASASMQQAGAPLAGAGSLSVPTALEAGGMLSGQSRLAIAAALQAGAPLAGQGHLTDLAVLAAGVALTGRGNLTGTPQGTGRSNSGLLLATFP